MRDLPVKDRGRLPQMVIDLRRVAFGTLVLDRAMTLLSCVQNTFQKGYLSAICMGRHIGSADATKGAAGDGLSG